MVEATVTLKKGGALVIVSESWTDLAATLKGYQIKTIKAQEISVSEFRQGKGSRSNE